MHTKTKILKNLYFDSVSLMTMTTKANQIKGVEQAFLGMGTEMNKTVLKNIGLLTTEAQQASESDLICIYQLADGQNEQSVYAQIEAIIHKSDDNQSQDDKGLQLNFASKEDVYQDSNLVIISVAGQYAAYETDKALDANKNVLLFSDNVPLADEVRLKRKAVSKNLLLMGPDCGTAIINGVGLAFANQVRKGNIGIVAASGTGSQEISVLIDQLGGGVSQLIGLGGREFSKEVGGMMALSALNLLEEDPQTKAIVLVSKPPSPMVSTRILSFVSSLSKPVVVYFVGSHANQYANDHNTTYAYSTYEAAVHAVNLADHKQLSTKLPAYNKNQTAAINHLKPHKKPAANYILGLYAGGTICDEAFHYVKARTNQVVANLAKTKEHQISDINNLPSHHHVFIDFGSDEFTVGRAHPMIDPFIRHSYLEKLASHTDQYGIIIMDFVLGYGANTEPLATFLPLWQKLVAKNPHLTLVAYPLGTAQDVQNKAELVAKLWENGIIVADNHMQAVQIAAEFVKLS